MVHIDLDVQNNVMKSVETAVKVVFETELNASLVIKHQMTLVGLDVLIVVT